MLVTLIPFSPPYIFVQRVFSFRKKDTILRLEHFVDEMTCAIKFDIK